MLAYLQKLKENISLVSIQQDKTESLLDFECSFN